MHRGKHELPVAWHGTMVNFWEAPAGMDLAPALKGLPDDLCQCPHWGYVCEGAVHVRYANGEVETVEAGNVFYWRPGHTAWFDQDTTWVDFSPEAEMRALMDHFAQQGPAE